MARPSYPSDEKRRKQRPHVKIHLSWPTHPRYGWVYADRDLRAIVVGIWLVSGRAHASATGNKVTVGPAQIAEITAISRGDHALRWLIRACNAMDWPTLADSKRPDIVTITVRNFGKKQGFHSAPDVDDSDTPHPSEEQKNQGTKEHKNRRQKRGAEHAERAKTDAPDELAPEDLARVTEYFATVSPGSVLEQLGARIESALLYYGREGIQHRDWARTVISNIVSNVNRERRQDGKKPLPSLGEARKRAAAIEAIRASPAPANGSLPFKPLTDREVEALIET